MSVTRSTYRGLRIAQSCPNEQRRDPRCMYIKTLGTTLYKIRYMPKLGDYTPMSIYRCIVL